MTSHPAGYYTGDVRQLEMYQRLTQYYSLTFQPLHQVRMLDMMNYNVRYFSHVLEPSEVFEAYRLEPGYYSPDASFELAGFVRLLEGARLKARDPSRSAAFKKLVAEAGVGLGNGCTGVMTAVLHAILSLPKKTFPRQNDAPEIVTFLPNYTIYAAQLSHLRRQATAHFVPARRENDFLPTFSDLRSAITRRTVAVILTYPTNPAQTTYEGERVEEIRSLVRYCQDHGIFLIVDNVYQDLVFPIGERPFEEIFLHTDRVEYVVKIYGSSKDTPFFSGYRTGYWLGDPRIADDYRYSVSAVENCLNSMSMVLFAFNLYFKSLMLADSQPELDDIKALFSDAVYGTPSVANRAWEIEKFHKLLDLRPMFEKILELDLYGNYRRRLDLALCRQETTLRRVRAFVEQCPAFIDFVNGGIGNLFFIRANPRYFPGDDDAFFNFALEKAKVGVLPGNVFGMPLVDGEAWFRITLIHKDCDDILQDLERLGESLMKNRAPDLRKT